MTVTFRKLHACGRDYLCLPDSETSAPGAIAKHLTAPENGIGADGVVLLRCCDGEDPVLFCFSTTGEQIPAPRGALLAGAKYLYDTARVNLTEFCLSERGTSHRVRLETRGGSAWGVTGDGGYPSLDAALSSATLSGLVREMPVTVGGVDCRLTVVSVAGSAVAVLHGKRETPPKPGGLLRLFTVPVSVLYCTDDPLAPRVLLRSREMTVPPSHRARSSPPPSPDASTSVSRTGSHSLPNPSTSPSRRICASPSHGKSPNAFAGRWNCNL